MTGAGLMKVCLGYKRKPVLSSSLELTQRTRRNTMGRDYRYSQSQSAVSVCPSLSAIFGNTGNFGNSLRAPLCPLWLKHSFVVNALCNQPAQGLPFSRDL